MILKILKWTVIVIGGLLLLALAFYGFIYWNTEATRKQRFEVVVSQFDIPSDSAVIAQGHHLAQIKGCTECHGDDMGGKVLFDDPMLGLLASANLTKGKGGLPLNYNSQDWIRALKHGLRQDQTPLLLMPSHETALLTETDMAALIAYCQQLPAVDRILPEPDLKPMVRVLAFLDVFPMFPAQKIDHQRPLVKTMEASISESYGQYLAISCTGCHGDNFKGLEAPAPGMLPRPDITASGNPGKWSEKEFITALRTGKTPEGKSLKPEDMPWPMTAKYTDVELQSLYRYLQSL